MAAMTADRFCFVNTSGTVWTIAERRNSLHNFKLAHKRSSLFGWVSLTCSAEPEKFNHVQAALSQFQTANKTVFGKGSRKPGILNVFRTNTELLCRLTAHQFAFSILPDQVQRLV